MGRPELIRDMRWMLSRGNLLAAWLKTKSAACNIDLQPILQPFDPASEYARENPGLVSETSRRSERICAGEIDLFSLSFSCTPAFQNWRKHPLSKAHIPSSRPSDFEGFQSDDLWLAYWLNTLPYAPLLAHGSMCGSHGARDGLIDMIDSWIRDQRPVPSPYWQSGLDVALRAIGLLYAWSLAGPNLPKSTCAQVTRIALLSGELLQRATERLSFNHLIVEAYGLFSIGLALRGSEAGRRWIERGSAILDAELRRQFFEDGMHGERSPGYMLLLCEIYLHFAILRKRANLQSSPDFDLRLLRMCEAMAELCCGNGLPAFSDNSELSLFSGGKDPSTVFALAAMIFSRSDFKARAVKFSVPAFWIGGDEGYRSFRNLPVFDSCERVSGALPRSGFYMMRGGGSELRVTCGHELSPKNGHSHADLLSFEIEICGDRVLADAGTYAYYPLNDWRRYFRSTSAHNTVTVDGQDQAAALPGDSFGWVSFPDYELKQWESSEVMDVFQAEHYGYKRLNDPVIHWRKIIFRKPNCWIVLDEISGTGEHDCDLNFQFTPGPVRLEGDVAVAHREWGRFEIWQLTRNCDASLESGSVDPIRGWVSSGYGHRTPAPSLRFRQSGKVPICFCTVMLAAKNDQRTLVRSRSDSSGDILKIQIGDSAESLRIWEQAGPEFSRGIPVMAGESHGD